MGLGSLARVLTSGVRGALEGREQGEDDARARTRELLAQRAAKRKQELDERELNERGEDRTENRRIREAQAREMAEDRAERRRISEEENRRRDEDRNADRDVRSSTVAVQSANASQANASRASLDTERQERTTRLQAEQRADYARKMVTAYGSAGAAMRAAEKRPSDARRLKLSSDDYFAAEQEFKDRLTAKSGSRNRYGERAASDMAAVEEAGESLPPSTAVPEKRFSSDPKVRRAQEIWDSTPAVQQARPRPN